MSADDDPLTWPILRPATPAHDFEIFTVDRHVAAHPRTGAERAFSVIHSRDWVNVIALTPADEVVLIRQFRHGTRAVTLEIPGGIIEPGESFLDAGRRELREETGYTAERWLDLGWVEPNPAIQDNRCGTVLALDARRTAETDFDPGELIAVERAPLAEIAGLITRGEIRHTLVISGFFLLVTRAGGWRRPG